MRMVDLELIGLLRDFGFPVFVACVLLYDKIKTNGSLRRVVENNNEILRRLDGRLENAYRQK